MSLEFRVRRLIASVLGCLVLLPLGTMAAGEPPVGRVLYSNHTTMGAASVAKLETVLSGDTLTTAADGSALVEFDSGARVKITENTTVRFVRDAQRIVVELQVGTVVTDTSSSPTIVVSTPKYNVEASQLGECRFMVRLSSEQATTAAALKGNAFVRAHKTSESFLLHEGNYVAIDADTSGVPPHIQVAGAKPQPSVSPGSHGGWRIGSLSEGESVALAAGIAAGAAAGIAIPMMKSKAGSPSAP